MEILVTGLRVFWIMAIFPIVIVFLPFPKLSLLSNMLTGFSRRGKTLLQSSSQKFTVPQKFFCHFYVVGVVMTTLLLFATFSCACSLQPLVSESLSHTGIATQLKFLSFTKGHKHEIWNSVLMLLLMEAQVVRRLFESLYVFKYSPSARMHIVGYLIGIAFYTAVPLSLCCEYASEMFKFVVNGYVESSSIKGKDLMQIKEIVHLRWYVWVGASVFSWGWIHQRRCHSILGSLREKGNQDESYVIPNGDWFDYVSCPHYLAEIVIYSGFVIAGGFSDLTLWLMFCFVVGNLALAANDTHNWYIRKFDDYPRDRREIIPFLY